MKPQHLKVLLILVLVMLAIPMALAETIESTYDTNGNLITGDGKFRVYNSFNQLWKVYNGSDDTGQLLIEFLYHPSEERVEVKKLYNSSDEVFETTIYISDNDVKVINATGTYDFTYIYHNDELISEIKPDGSKVYYHDDHLGSTSTVTDQSGNAIENTTYSSYGEILTGGESRFDYTGKEYEENLGDYDFDARRYDPETAQFTTPDLIIQNAYDPQFLNRYAYARNNPYIYIDPDGHTVRLVLRNAFGREGVGHFYLDIVPDNPQDFRQDGDIDYTQRFTIGGQPTSWLFGDLAIIANQEDDYQATGFIQQIEIPTPDGMTDTEFIEALVALYQQYDDSLDYDLDGGQKPDEGNSNVAATSLLIGSGVDPGFFETLEYEEYAPGTGRENEEISGGGGGRLTTCRNCRSRGAYATLARFTREGRERGQTQKQVYKRWRRQYGIKD